MTEHGDTDVLILGGGPAGSTAGILLAARGIATRIVEAEQFPRFHVGESLLPATLPLLDRLGVHEQVRSQPGTLRKEGATFSTSDGDRTVTYWFDQALHPVVTHAYQVRRAELDTVLLDRARAMGVDVWQGWRATAPVWDGDRLAGLVLRDAAGSERTLRARVVLDASGQAAFLANRMGWRFPYPHHDRVAAFSHVRGAGRASGREAGNITIALTRGGWLWLIPFADDVTSVGVVLEVARWRECAGGAAEVLERTIADTPAVARLMEGAQQVRAPAAVQNFSYRVIHRAGDGYCMIGDAAGFLDPIFSTGVFLATTTAESAAQDIADALARHSRVDGNDFAPTVSLTRSLHRLFFGFIRAFYDPHFLPLLFNPRDVLSIPPAIVSLLAADVAPSGRWRKTVRFRALVALARLDRLTSRLGVNLVEPITPLTGGHGS